MPSQWDSINPANFRYGSSRCHFNRFFLSQQIFHRAVVQALHLSDTLVRHIPAQLAHMQGKTLRITRIFCQPVKVLYMHAVAPRTTHRPAVELQIDSPSSNREITYSHNLLVVTPSAAMSTGQTGGCFFRLLSWMTRAYRSPYTPTNFDETVKPGKAKRARID